MSWTLRSGAIAEQGSQRTAMIRDHNHQAATCPPQRVDHRGLSAVAAQREREGGRCYAAQRGAPTVATAEAGVHARGAREAFMA